MLLALISRKTMNTSGNGCFDVPMSLMQNVARQGLAFSSSSQGFGAPFKDSACASVCHERVASVNPQYLGYLLQKQIIATAADMLKINPFHV